MITLHHLTVERLTALTSALGASTGTDTQRTYTLEDGSTVLIIYNVDTITVRPSDYDTLAIEVCEDYLDDPDCGLIWILG